MATYSDESSVGLERCNKKFLHKFTQIVVQSRTGEKLQTKTKFSSKTTEDDAFGIVIEDDPGVTETMRGECKKQKTLMGLTYNVDITLQRQAENGETMQQGMVLETWSRVLLPQENTEPSCGTPHNLNTRMGTALKSLVCTTRIPPTYYFARQTQATESDYTICYQVYFGEPHTKDLGEPYERIKVCSVPTPAGSIQIHLAHRTKVTMVNPQPSHPLNFTVKYDHFDINSKNPQRQEPQICRTRPRRDSTEGPRTVYGSPDSLHDAVFSENPILCGIKDPSEQSVRKSSSSTTQENPSDEVLDHPMQVPFASAPAQPRRSPDPDPLQVLRDIQQKAAAEVKERAGTPQRNASSSSSSSTTGGGTTSTAASASAASTATVKWSGPEGAGAERKSGEEALCASDGSDASLQNSYVMVDTNGSVRVPFACTDPGSSPQDLFYELKTAVAPGIARDEKKKGEEFMEEMESTLEMFEKKREHISELLHLLNVSAPEEDREQK